MTPPQWTSTGYSANTEAALADSLHWLRVLAILLARHPSIDLVQRDANVDRLLQCIASAESFLPAEVAHEAVAAVVIS